MISSELWGFEAMDPLGEALSNAVQETLTWARRHEADGRYSDAEYLIRRVDSGSHGIDSFRHTWSHLSEDVLPTMVSIYEKMGDYTAAEVCQERLVKQLLAKIPSISDIEKLILDQFHAVTNLSRLLSNFKKRILDLVPEPGGNPRPYEDVSITYRAALLDVKSLNLSLLLQGLIPLAPREEKCCTSLHVAAKENAINLARRLLEMGADVNSEDERSCTPLHIAAYHAGSEMMILLLENQAKIEAVDDAGCTPLDAAMIGRRPQEIIAYLVNARADIDAQNANLESALRLAISDNLQAVAPLLLEKGANVEASGHGEAPLLTAVKHNRIWAVDLLLAKGANLANLLGENVHGQTVLFIAVVANRESVVRSLLYHGASYEEGENVRIPILHCAIKIANVSIVEMLLKARIGIHTRNLDGDTALHCAISWGQEPHERIFKLLLAHDAVGMQEANSYGNTALHYVVSFGRRNMLVLLLELKRDELPDVYDMRNSRGLTALDMARAMAQFKRISSDEVSILYLLENAFRPVSAIRVVDGVGDQTRKRVLDGFGDQTRKRVLDGVGDQMRKRYRF